MLGVEQGSIGGKVTCSDGKVTEFLADKTANDNTLSLTAVTFYPNGAKGNEFKNQLGKRAMIEIFQAMKDYANSFGVAKCKENIKERKIAHLQIRTRF